MRRFFPIAVQAIENAPDEEMLTEASAVIDDALCTLADIYPEYYEHVLDELAEIAINN